MNNNGKKEMKDYNIDVIWSHLSKMKEVIGSESLRFGNLFKVAHLVLVLPQRRRGKGIQYSSKEKKPPTGIAG